MSWRIGSYFSPLRERRTQGFLRDRIEGLKAATGAVTAQLPQPREETAPTPPNPWTNGALDQGQQRPFNLQMPTESATAGREPFGGFSPMRQVARAFAPPTGPPGTLTEEDAIRQGAENATMFGPLANRLRELGRPVANDARDIALGSPSDGLIRTLMERGQAGNPIDQQIIDTWREASQQRLEMAPGEPFSAALGLAGTAAEKALETRAGRTGYDLVAEGLQRSPIPQTALLGHGIEAIPESARPMVGNLATQGGLGVLAGRVPLLPGRLGAVQRTVQAAAGTDVSGMRPRARAPFAATEEALQAPPPRVAPTGPPAPGAAVPRAQPEAPGPTLDSLQRELEQVQNSIRAGGRDRAEAGLLRSEERLQTAIRNRTSPGGVDYVPEAPAGAGAMTFDEFSASRGVDTTPPAFPEAHRAPGGVSGPTQRAMSRRIGEAGAAWQEQRNALRLEYDDLVSRGEIRAPSRTERLQQAAQGEGEAAEAARRLLAKQPARPLASVADDAERAVGTRVVKDGQEATVVQIGKRGEIIAQTDEGVTVRGQPADFTTSQVARSVGGGADEGPTPVQKVITALRGAKRVTPDQEALRSQEMARRFARAGGAMETAVGKGRLRAGLGQLKGPQPRVVLEDLAINEGDQLQLYEQVHNFYAGKPRTVGTRITTMQGLETLMLGGLPQPAQIGHLEDVFGPELINAFKEATRTGRGRVLDEALALLNAPRTIMSSFFDFSGVGRQAAMAGPGHPKEVWGNVPNYLRYFAKERNFQDAMDVVRQHPLYPQAVDDGLSLIGVREASQGMGGAEEAFMSLGERTFVGRFLKAVPGIRATERGYTGFLTKLRWDLYNRFSPGLAVAERKDLAKMINAFTGRGTLGPLEKLAPAMNSLFFAARLQAGRLQAPIMPLLVKSPAVRKLAARDLLAFVGEGAAVLALLKYSGAADVELDPRSTDWGKVKLGPTRIDFWGGVQPIARLVAREVSGQTKTSGGDIMNIERDVALWNFIKSKFAPVPGLVEEARAGETFTGESMEWAGGTIGREGQELVTPLMIQGIREAVKESGWGHGLLVGGATFAGWGAMSYTTPAVMRNELFREKALAGEFGEEYKAKPDYDASRGDRTLAENDPELRALVLAADRENQRRQNPAAVLRASRAEQVGEEEVSLRLPALAQEIERGEPGAPEKFRTAIGELRETAGDFAARDYYGEDFGGDKAGAYRQWADLQNTDFEDDDAFWAEKDRLYSKLPARLRDAIEARTTGQDPAVRALEAALNKDRQAIEATGYWDVPERWWTDFGGDVQERLPDVRSFSDLTQQASVNPQAREILSRANRQITAVKERRRMENPELDAMLAYWYGNSPFRQDATRLAFRRLYPNTPLPIPRDLP